jgi:hypothetical protein
MRRACTVFFVVGALLAVGAPSAFAAWDDPACEEDGSDILGTAECTPPGEPPGVPPDPNSCEGAVYCERTYAELDAAGFSSADMKLEDKEEKTVADKEAKTDWGGGGGGGGCEPSCTSSFSTTEEGGSTRNYSGWVSWYNYNDKKCQGTVRDNNHCAWLYHKYRIYVDGEPTPTVYNTAYPSRSGNNNPPDKWRFNVGPIPDRFKSCPEGSCVTKRAYRWGRQNGVFTKYEEDLRASFYPGKWRLDPWTIYKPSDTSVDRGAFEIHGGRNDDGSSRLWTTRTQGCIRLTIGGVNGLKRKWDNRTDNKRRARVYVEHNA